MMVGGGGLNTLDMIIETGEFREQVAKGLSIPSG